MAALYFEQAQADFEKEKNGDGLVRLAACWRAAVAAEDPGWKHTAWGAISAWARYTPSPRMVFAPAENVEKVAFSSDGRAVLVGCKDNQTGRFGGRTARLWDTVNGQPLGPLMKFDDKVKVIAFSPDARTVATLGETPDSGTKVTPSEGTISSLKYEIRVWDAATGQPIGEPLRPGGTIHDVVFSPDGRTLLIIARIFYEPLLWNPTTGKTRMLERVPERREDISDPVLFESGCFSPHGRSVLICANRGRAFIWDTVTAKLLNPVLKHDLNPSRHERDNELIVVEYSPDGRTVLTATREGDGAPCGTRPPASQAVGEPPSRPEGVNNNGLPERTTVAFSPDSLTVLIGSPLLGPDKRRVFSGDVFFNADCSARLCDAATGLPLGDPLRHQGEAVAFSPDGRIFVTASNAGEVRLWDAASSRPIGLPLPTGHVTVLKFTPDGSTLLTGGVRGAMLWHLAVCQPNGPHLYHQGVVECAAFSPDGRKVLTGANDSRARLWDAVSGQRLGPPMPLRSPFSFSRWAGSMFRVARVGFSPDGRVAFMEGDPDAPRPPIGWWDTPGLPPTLLNYASAGGEVMGLWNAATGRPFELSADVQRAAQEDREDAQSQPSQRQKGKKPRGLIGMAFRADGLTLLIASRDGTARLWDASSGRPLGPPMEKLVPIEAPGADRDLPSPNAEPPTEHGATIRTELSPDGRTVSTLHKDGTAQWWDATTGQPINLPLERPAENRAPPADGDNLLVRTSLSTDGRTALKHDHGIEVRLRDAATGRQLGPPLKHQSGVATTKFSPDERTVLSGCNDGTARLWDVAEWPDEWASDVTLPIEAMTGGTLDEQGAVLFLDKTAWSERLHQLASKGIPLSQRPRWSLDPVLFGPKPM